MNAYQPTDEQIESLATHEFEMSTSCEWATARDGEQDDFRNWARQMSESPAFQAIIQAAQAGVLRDTARGVRAALSNEVGGHTSTYTVRTWLIQEADRIEAADVL